MTLTKDVKEEPGRETKRNENQRKNRVYLDHSTFKISLNTQKGPGDLRRLAIIQTQSEKPLVTDGMKNS